MMKYRIIIAAVPFLMLLIGCTPNKSISTLVITETPRAFITQTHTDVVIKTPTETQQPASFLTHTFTATPTPELYTFLWECFDYYHDYFCKDRDRNTIYSCPENIESGCEYDPLDNVNETREYSSYSIDQGIYQGITDEWFDGQPSHAPHDSEHDIFIVLDKQIYPDLITIGNTDVDVKVYDLVYATAPLSDEFNYRTELKWYVDPNTKILLRFVYKETVLSCPIGWLCEVRDFVAIESVSGVVETNYTFKK